MIDLLYLCDSWFWRYETFVIINNSFRENNQNAKGVYVKAYRSICFFVKLSKNLR